MSEHTPEEQFDEDRRENLLAPVRDRFDEHVERIEGWLHTWCSRVLIGFAIIGFTSAIALAGFGYVLYVEKEKVRDLCEARNIRHDNGITALKIGSDQDQLNAPNEAVRAEIRRRRDVTISLINNIQPKIDCDNPRPVKRLKEPK